MQAQNLLPSWIIPFIKQPKTALPDIMAGLMMAVLVIPQSLGYAALAGLPPIMGLYASVMPVLIYAWLGASSISAVGPVAITAIMTAAALSNYATGSLQYITLAITLAFMVGVVLWLASILRLGWIMQFVSRGVAAGFISGAAILIMLSQLRHILGVRLNTDSLSAAAASIYQSMPALHLPTLILGLSTLVILIIAKKCEPLIKRVTSARTATFSVRLFSIVVVAVSIILAHRLDFMGLGIAVVESVPMGLPAAKLPELSLSTILDLLPSALLIALIAFISSSSIASHHARLRAEHYDNNKELMGLGLANVTSGLFGGFAVAGGISRTSLNLSVGANSPMASLACALGVLTILLFFGQYLVGLPLAVLAALIISSVTSMIDKATFRAAWQYDKADAFCFLSTFFVVVVFGLNIGLVAGLLVSFASMIYRTHQVHIAVLGRVGDSEHYRNVERYPAKVFDGLLMLRIDESLYFGNSETVYQQVQFFSSTPQDEWGLKPKSPLPDAPAPISDVLLVMTAVNHIDLAALEMLIRLNSECTARGQRLHLAEVKGPVMDHLKDSPLMDVLTGEVFLSVDMAVKGILDNK